MLPWPRWTHDQLLRKVFVAGLGGLILGHVLWLIGISLATNETNVNQAVLVLSVLCGIAAVIAGVIARNMYRQRRYVWAAFLAGLPVSPLVFSLIVLGVTYL